MRKTRSCACPRTTCPCSNITRTVTRTVSMAVRLPRTDIVVVGLGGAGGVAVEPLTAAGRNVIGLEAGTRLTPKDFAPDELRNNFRGWPQAAQKANREIPVHRANAQAPDDPRAAIHP